MAAALKLNIYLGEIPEEGLALKGTLDRAVFDLQDGQVRPLSDLAYDLRVSLADGNLILMGSLEAAFECVCVRSLKPFSHLVRLENYCESLEVENRADLDLTDRLREDILLALPAYPHSPESESEELFPSSEGAPRQASKEPTDSIWDALDGIPKKN